MSSSLQDDELKISATIKDVKALLCDMYKFPENHLDFFLAGQPLMDFQKVVDCGFVEGTVDLVFRNIVGIKIFVKLPSSQDTTEIDANSEDTVRKVKSMIQAKVNIQVDQFTLVYDGKLLEDNMTLASVNMKNKSTVYMVTVPKDTLSISVKIPSREILKFTVKPLFTVRDVKTIVQSYIGCSISDHALIYSGIELEDMRALAFYEVKDESVLELSYPSFQIFVKVCDVMLIPFDVKQSDTVEQLKSAIFYKLGVSTEKYSLFHDSIVLQENRSMASLNIHRESTINMIFNSGNVICFVEVPSGKYHFQFKALDTIHDVKQIVQRSTKCSIVDCSIVYKGNQLKDFKTIAFYNIENDATLELKPSWFQIFVRAWSGKTLTLDVTPSNTVKEVKEKIHCKVKVPVIYQRIVFAGRRLEDDRSLSSYNIQKEYTLHMA